LEKAQHLKLILSAFEQLSGLKINFHKSDLFCFGESINEVNAHASLFSCGQGQFPMRYLGIPIHYRRLTLAEWKLVEERVQKRLSSWKGKLLSLGVRLVLINSVLSNMVLHMISFLLPKGVLQKLDYYRSRFFWQGDSKKKKYRLAKWRHGVMFAVLRTKEDLGFMTYRSRIRRFLVSGCLSYSLRMGLGQQFLKGNILVKKHYHRFYENQVIRTSRLA
jgi:hypothetical protein